MSKLDIIIRGVAIVYFKQDLFKVLFPFGDGHRVTLRVPGRNPVDFDEPGRRINISGATSATTSPTFGRFIDITDKNAHKDGVRLLPTWANSGVLLTVPGAEFSEAESSRSRYVLTKRGLGAPPGVGAKIGFAARLRLSGPSFNFEITPAGPGDPLPISGDAEITFDNLCPTCPDSDEDADFRLIYNLIVDDAVPERQFSLARHSDDLPTPPTRGELLFNEIFGFRPPPHIARPDNNNPEPRIAGLPCNVVVASKSSKLA
jgi:hypothetical protein